MDLKDPKDYNHASQGRRELSHYEAEYDSAKQSEAINANTDELETLTQATNSKLDTSNANTTSIRNDVATMRAKLESVDTRLQAISGYVDALESKLDSVLGRLDNIIDLMAPAGPEV